LTEDETVFVVEHFLRSHPWVRPQMEAAPTDAEATEIAKRELGNSGFGDPQGWSADCIFNRGKGIAVTQTPTLGRIARAIAQDGKARGVPYISWRQVAEYVRGRPVQGSLF